MIKYTQKHSYIHRNAQIYSKILIYTQKSQIYSEILIYTQKCSNILKNTQIYSEILKYT